MSKKLAFCLASLLVLTFALSAAHGETTIIPREQPREIIRLYQEGLPADVDLDLYVETGEVQLVTGQLFLPPKIVPGPAPETYPHIHMWEPGFEQLGADGAKCDGIWFINGNLWHPKKWALVLWKIRVPDPRARDASEYEKDLTMSLWVDWNQDQMWAKNEKMLNCHINIEEYFPPSSSYLEIWYLTSFRIPTASQVSMDCGYRPNERIKLWARGVLSYDDPDTSPDGECLFGEVEDYLINYFEIDKKEKKVDN